MATGKDGGIDSVPDRGWGEIMINAQFCILDGQPHAPCGHNYALDICWELSLDDGRGLDEESVHKEELGNLCSQELTFDGRPQGTKLFFGMDGWMTNTGQYELGIVE